MFKFENWVVAEPDPHDVDKLAVSLGISPLVATLLINRNITRVEAARQFLTEQWNGEIPGILGLKEAVALLRNAGRQGTSIVIYGDYDVDGICSTAIMYECLCHLGYVVTYRLPNRFVDGYGLTMEAVNEMAAAGAELLLTVDCGITAVNEVKLAGELGLKTIITDHHQPASELPAAEVIINPRVNPEGEGQELCGAGVAFCLALSLLASEGQSDYSRRWLDLVALATVADIVPLTGYNRVWVQAGLQLMRKREGINQLLIRARVREGELSTYHLGYILAPRLNAAGRLHNAEPALELLLTDSPAMAQELAIALDELNAQRQQLEELIYQQALEQIKDWGEDIPEILVVGGDGWHQGVVGIVASRVAQRYQRPAIIIAWAEETGKGSARSVSGFDILEALRQSAVTLDHFGGHRGAAGIEVNRSNYGAFCKQINQVASDCYFDASAVSTLYVDGRLENDSLNMDLGYLGHRLRPYGEGNPAPVFMANVIFNRVSRMGKNSEHFKGWLTGHEQTEVICFREGNLAEEIVCGQCYQIAFSPEINEFNGKRSLSLRLMDIRPEKASGLNTRWWHQELGQESSPEILVCPDQRTLELLWPYYREIWGERAVALCGRAADGAKATAMLTQGEARLFLTTPVYFPYHIKKFGPLKAGKVWLLLDPKVYQNAFLELVHDLSLRVEVIAASGPTATAINESEVWYSRHQLYEASNYQFDETQARLRCDKLKLRQSWMTKGGTLISAGDVLDHQPVITHRLKLVDAPLSLGEWELLQQNYNPEQLIKEFTVTAVDRNRQHLLSQYPDAQLVKEVLEYLAAKAASQQVYNRDRLQHDIGLSIGRPISWLTLSGVLAILVQTGVFAIRFAHESMAINMISKGGEVRLADSLSYLEGKWELRAWSIWEQELQPMAIIGGD